MSDFESLPQFNDKEKPGQLSTLTHEAVTTITTNTLASKMKEVFEEARGLVEYTALKVKERFGRLSREEFEQLLALDFQEFLDDNPPIEGVFSPEEELRKIRELPREQRREALATFKKNLVRQQKALAALRVFIERSIEFNHDFPRKKLVDLFEKFAAHYGFDSRHRGIFEKIMDGYYENRWKVLKMREKFPDDRRLVYELTGVNIGKDEKLDVSIGPMSIDIRVEGYNAKKMFKRWLPVVEPNSRFPYGGFASQSSEGVCYTVVNLDKEARVGDPTGEGTRMHEYQHLINNALFRRVLGSREAPEFPWEYRREFDPTIRAALLEDFFRRQRQFALEIAKDEILSCLCNINLSQLWRQLLLGGLFFKQDGGPYDYLASLRNWRAFEDDPLYQKTAQRMLVKEYKEIILRAVEFFAKLVTKGKFSTQEAIALLADKPLEDWPKAVERLLEKTG